MNKDDSKKEYLNIKDKDICIFHHLKLENVSM